MKEKKRGFSKKSGKFLLSCRNLALGSFILAGLTGFLFRLGTTGADIFGLSLENIRHAHSHLMFFAWAVPLPMYFIITSMSSKAADNSSVKLMSRMTLFSLLLGLASYPSFLMYGYRPVPLFGMDLPVSVMISGLVMLCWYGFMVGYRNTRKHLSSVLSQHFYDAALIMLFISSLGAWGVAAAQFSGVQNPLYGTALTHFFLATFTEGWIILVLLGLVYEHLGISVKQIPISPSWLTVCILFGAPLTFPYGIAEGLLTPQLQWAARAGGFLAAAGLGLNLYTILSQKKAFNSWFWKTILLLLTFKAGIQFLVSVLPGGFEFTAHSFRILYLHLLLLGAFSLALFIFLADYLSVSYQKLTPVFISVFLVLLSLFMLTSAWPVSWLGYWRIYIITAVALLPSLSALYFWLSAPKETITSKPV